MGISYCDIAPGHEWHGPYHDREYGFPLRGDAELFERLVLEINQAGLSWLTILKKRDAFRRAYDGFDPAIVARRRAGPRAAAGRRRHHPQPAQGRAAIDNAGRILELPKTTARSPGGSRPITRCSKAEWVKLFKPDLPVHRRRNRGRIPDEHRRPSRRAPAELSGVSADPAAAAALGPASGRRPPMTSEWSPGRPARSASTMGETARPPCCSCIRWRVGPTTGRRRWSIAARTAGPWPSTSAGTGARPPKDRAEIDIETLADDVRAVADACGLRRFALVGHSLGGGVALAFAGAYPDRVDRLLLLDPIGDGTQIPAAEVQPFLDRLDSPAYPSAIESYWGTISGPDDAVRERLLADLRATPQATVVAGFRASLRFDPTTSLLRYRGPALAVVTPANDAPFSLHRVGRLPHRVVEGTGHWIQLDRPAEFARLLDGFLQAPA